MARRLGIPVRTWYNYEGGVTVPAEVILKIIELTSVEPVWLLHGKGPKFRSARADRPGLASPPAMTVGALLRTALQLLENEGSAQQETEQSVAGLIAVGGMASAEGALDWSAGAAALPAADSAAPPEGGDLIPREPRASVPQTRQEWLAAQRENRCISVSGDAMAPVVANGASVAYSAHDEDVRHLDGKMVVIWLEGQPVVRWFQHCGRYALLRAENPKAVPQQILVDLEDPREPPRFRRVLWINTPH
jgi:hypothetical protein